VLVGGNSNSCFGLLQQVMKSAGKEWVLETIVSITPVVTYIFNFMKSVGSLAFILFWNQEPWFYHVHPCLGLFSNTATLSQNF
jgi:hypothetical protein